MRGRMSGVATSVVNGTVVGSQALAPGWPVRRAADEGRRHVGPTFLADAKEMGVTPQGVKPRPDRPARSISWVAAGVRAAASKKQNGPHVLRGPFPQPHL